jgi:hypothetical protein
VLELFLFPGIPGSFVQLGWVEVGLDQDLSWRSWMTFMRRDAPRLEIESCEWLGMGGVVFSGEKRKLGLQC